MGEGEITTLDSILNAAKSEFLEKGYRGASLRNIAKKAGVTTGAFYGYFKNKEQIFERLVGCVYNGLIGIYKNVLKNFQNQSPEDQFENMFSFSEQGMLKMIDYIFENFETFKLIICCSEGTGYSNLIHDMAKMEVEATHDFAKSTGSAGMPLKHINSNVEHILTSGMFSAYFEIVRHDIPRDEAYEYIEQLFDFYSAGWAKIMGL